jgi:hypothetical protein
MFLAWLWLEGSQDSQVIGKPIKHFADEAVLN